MRTIDKFPSQVVRVNSKRQFKKQKGAQLEVSQSGFRKGSCIQNHIFTIRQLNENIGCGHPYYKINIILIILIYTNSNVITYIHT